MEHDSDLAKRTGAFQTLLRDVGEQLGRQNTDDIEFFESMPQDERGKGGIRLLEYLRNRGRFTQWRIEPLREILRRCNRCDLADNLVKKYQLNFGDRDSPQTPRPLTDHVASSSPLLSSHKRSRSSPISWLADIDHHPTTLGSSASLPQQENMSPASSHCISGSLPNDCRGFGMPSSPSHFRQRSEEYQSPVQEGSLSTASLSRLDNFFHARKNSIPNIHMHPRQNCCSNNRYELANTAIRAMLEIVTHTNRSPSCTSIHSDNSFDYQTTTSQSFSDEGKQRSLTANGGLDGNETPVLVRRASDRTSSSPPSKRSSSDCQPATGSVLGFHVTPTLPHPTPEGGCASGQESVSRPSPKQMRLPRPVSGYRKLPLDNFRWLVKQDRLMKSVLRPQETKFQAIVCSQRLDLEVGEGKFNPKLSLILYPNGLFINKGKSASLQVKIVTPDKCPPLPPSLLVQLNVTVYGNDGQEMWKQACTQETINTYSFYIHDLFTCQTVRHSKGDYIHLNISVQIQKAIEQ